jgi:hypothetical protein
MKKASTSFRVVSREFPLKSFFFRKRILRGIKSEKQKEKGNYISMDSAN